MNLPSLPERARTALLDAFAVDGCGRANVNVQRLAKRAGLSVHMVQSAYYGRKNLSDAAAKRVLRKLGISP